MIIAMPPEPIPPQPGQESVWDYPRPATLEDTTRHLKVICQGIVLAETRRGKRVLETSHPPTYYFPPEHVQGQYLVPTGRGGVCEWKGGYAYYDIHLDNGVIPLGAWQYVAPTPNFQGIQDYYGFFVRSMDACYVDNELVVPQPGDFYGGWITTDVVGPFKGGPGTWGW